MHRHGLLHHEKDHLYICLLLEHLFAVVYLSLSANEDHSSVKSKFILSLESSVKPAIRYAAIAAARKLLFLSQLNSCPTFLCNSTNPREKKVQRGGGTVQSCTMDQVPNFFFFFFLFSSYSIALPVLFDFLELSNLVLFTAT